MGGGQSSVSTCRRILIFTDLLHEGICVISNPTGQARSSEKHYHEQHVARSRLNASSQRVVLVHDFTLVRGRDRDGA